MKAILKYKLPEDQENFHVATHATDLFLTLWDMDQLLRSYQKHHAFESPDDAIDTMREHLRDIMHERGISLDMMS